MVRIFLIITLILTCSCEAKNNITGIDSGIIIAEELKNYSTKQKSKLIIPDTIIFIEDILPETIKTTRIKKVTIDSVINSIAYSYYLTSIKKDSTETVSLFFRYYDGHQFYKQNLEDYQKVHTGNEDNIQYEYKY